MGTEIQLTFILRCGRHEKQSHNLTSTFTTTSYINIIVFSLGKSLNVKYAIISRLSHRIATRKSFIILSAAVKLRNIRIIIAHQCANIHIRNTFGTMMRIWRISNINNKMKKSGWIFRPRVEMATKFRNYTSRGRQTDRRKKKGKGKIILVEKLRGVTWAVTSTSLREGWDPHPVGVDTRIPGSTTWQCRYLFRNFF